MSVLLQCLQCPLMRVRRMVYFELDRREINNYSMSARYISHFIVFLEGTVTNPAI